MATIKLSWGDDLKAENDFVAMGIPFSKRAVSFKRLDLPSSRQNGARFEPIHRDLVDDYKQGMRNGDTFPRPVVHEIPGQFFFVDSGIQRTCAVEELIAEGFVPKDCTIDVYQLETDDAMLLEAVARSANVSHGGRSSQQERVMHAVYMASHHGMAVKQAAKLFMISETTINMQVRANANRKELAENGIRADHVSPTSLALLDKVDFDESLKLKVGSLVAQHEPTIDRVRLMTDQLKKSRSDNDRGKIVKKWEKELSDESRRHVPKNHPVLRKAIDRPRRDRILRDLQRLSEWLEAGNDGEAFTCIGHLQIVTKEDYATLRDTWQRLRFRMDGIVADKRAPR